VAAEVPARAQTRLTLLSRSLLWPSIVRIEHPAAHPGRRPFSTLPACWPVYRSCRNEHVVGPYYNALAYAPPVKVSILNLISYSCQMN